MLARFHSFLIAAMVALILPVQAWAQSVLPPDTPGVFTTQEYVRSSLDSAYSDARLLAVLRQMRLCLSDRELALRLRRADVPVDLIPQSAARDAIRSGECDLYLAAQAADRLAGIVAPGDDVERARDREGPTITVRQDVFTGTTGSVDILAGISDPSGVARAEADSWQGVRRMVPRSGQIHGVDYTLPPHYRPEPLVLRAVDELGNASEVRLTLRRLPVCGDPEGVNRDIVARIQEDLNAIGRNAGVVDGFAGDNTCQALAEHGIVGPFDWGKVAEGLGLDRIGLSAPAEVETAIGRALVRVEVVDPRDTRVVTRIRMLRGGLVATNRTVENGQAEFEVNLPPGGSETVAFEAVDARGRVLAEASTRVVRAAEVKLRINGPDLIDDRLASPESRVELQAEMTGLTRGVIAYRGPGGQGESADYLGAPLRFGIEMPPPGETARLAFVAIGPDRETRDTREITLFREPVKISVTPSPELSLDAETGQLTVLLIGARSGTRLELRDAAGRVLDTGEHAENRTWTARAPMPPEGERVEVTVVALDRSGEMLGTPQRVTLVRPGRTLPPWLLPGSVGLVLLWGIVGGGISILRKRRKRAAAPEPPKDVLKPPPADIRVTAVPDPAPEIEGPDAALPALTLRVEPGEPGEPVIEIEDEEEPDRP